MKHKLLYIVSMAVLSFSFASCSPEKWPTFDPSDAYVAMKDTVFSAYEDQSGILAIPVGVSGAPGQSVTVSFSFTTAEGSAFRNAVEGVDFQLLNPAKELHYPSGTGYDTIRIQMINNTVKDAHSSFRVQLASANPSYAIGFSGQRSYADVTLYDDESMSPFEGVWEVSGKSVIFQNGTSTGDTTINSTIPILSYEVTIVPHPTEMGVLVVKNFMGSIDQYKDRFSVNMVVDTVALTVTLKHGLIGQFDNRDVQLYTFDNDIEVSETSDIPGSLSLNTNGTVNTNTMNVWQYAAIIYVNGNPYGLSPGTTVLKSTWKKVKK